MLNSKLFTSNHQLILSPETFPDSRDVDQAC